jgi:hypothetical protein
MKKAVVIALLFIAGAAFAQDFTFQGLPWGATKEQVIEKLGEPDTILNGLVGFRLNYRVNLNGNRAGLYIYFDNGMSAAGYSISRYSFSDTSPFITALDTSQFIAIFNNLFSQLVIAYGPYNETMTENNDAKRTFAWHFNNFHITLSQSNHEIIHITYYSDNEWNLISPFLQ